MTEHTPHSSPEWFRARRFSYEHLSNQGTVKVSGDATGAVHGLVEQLQSAERERDDLRQLASPTAMSVIAEKVDAEIELHRMKEQLDTQQHVNELLDSANDALTKRNAELVEQLQAAEKALETPRQYDVLLSDMKEQLEAKERERVEWEATARVESDHAEELREQLQAALDSTMHQENYDAACLRADEAEEERDRLKEQSEATYEIVRRYVVEISRAPGNRDQDAIDAASEALVALVSSPACKHPDVSFDRSICACGDMHHYCRVCGAQVDPCNEPSPTSAPAPTVQSDGTAGAEDSSPASSPKEADSWTGSEGSAVGLDSQRPKGESPREGASPA